MSGTGETPQKTVESPQERALRWKNEEDKLMQLLVDQHASEEAMNELIAQLGRKHEHEATHDVVLDLHEFGQIENPTHIEAHHVIPEEQMTGDALHRALGTPEFAAYGRKDIETILDREGVPEGDIGTRIDMFKRRMALVDALAAVPDELANDAASSVEPPPVIEAVASDVPDPAVSPEREISQEDKEILVSELNSVKDKLDQRFGVMRVYDGEKRDGVKLEYRTYSDEDYRNAKRESNELRVRAKELAFEIVDRDALLGNVKIPDLFVVNMIKTRIEVAVSERIATLRQKDPRAEIDKRKLYKIVERGLPKDEMAVYYAARDRQADFEHALTDHGVRGDAARLLYEQFVSRASQLKDFAATLGESAPTITGGRDFHLLKWHDITPGLSWEETRKEIDDLVAQYNSIPPRGDVLREPHEVPPALPVSIATPQEQSMPTAATPILSGVYELREGGHVHNANDVSPNAPYLDTDKLAPSGGDLGVGSGTLSGAAKKDPMLLYSTAPGRETYDGLTDRDRAEETIGALWRGGNAKRPPMIALPVAPTNDPLLSGQYHVRDGVVHAGAVEGEGQALSRSTPHSPEHYQANVASTKEAVAQLPPSVEKAETGRGLNELKREIDAQYELINKSKGTAEHKAVAQKARQEIGRLNTEFEQLACEIAGRDELRSQIKIGDEKLAFLSFTEAGKLTGNVVEEYRLAKGRRREFEKMLTTHGVTRATAGRAYARFFDQAKRLCEISEDITRLLGEGSPAPKLGKDDPDYQLLKIHGIPEELIKNGKLEEISALLLPIVDGYTNVRLPELSGTPIERVVANFINSERKYQFKEIEQFKDDPRVHEAIKNKVYAMIAQNDMQAFLGLPPYVLELMSGDSMVEAFSRGLPSKVVTTNEADVRPADDAEGDPSSTPVDVAPSPREKAGVPKKPEVIPELSAKEKYELDHEGSLWASFIEREYGLDVNGQKLGENTPAPMLAPTIAEAVTSPIKSKETAPEKPIDLKALSPVVAEQFKAVFGVEENKLREIPEFAALSEGQQMLVRYQLLNETVTGIEGKALKMYRDKYAALTPELNKVEKWAVGRKSIVGGIAKVVVGLAQFRHKGTWQKMGMGIMRKKLVVDNEKELRAQVANGTDDKTEYIRELSRQAKDGPDAELIEGKLALKFLKKEDVGDGLTPEEATMVERFNEAAVQFGLLSHKWREQGASPLEQERYKNEEATYRAALSALLPILEKKGNAESALIDANELDRRVTFTQFFNTHPSAEMQLADIKNTSSWWEFTKDTVQTRSMAFGLGLTTRTAAAFAASQVVSAGSMFLAAPVAGAAVGRFMGGRRANAELRERELLAKMGVKDKSAERDSIVNAVGEKGAAPIAHETSLTGRIDKILADIKATKDDEMVGVKIGGRVALRSKKEQLLEKLELRIAYAEDKRRDGKINYGEGLGRIKNQYALLEALRGAKATVLIERAKKVVEEIKDPASGAKIEKNWREDKRTAAKRLLAIIDSNDKNISAAKNAYISKTKTQAGWYGAAFGFGGALVADLVHGAIAPGTSVAENAANRAVDIYEHESPNITKMFSRFGFDQSSEDGMVAPKELVTIPASRPADPSGEVALQPTKAGSTPEMIPASPQAHSAEFGTYAEGQSKEFGRALSPAEARALWSTDQSPEHMTPDYHDSVHGKVHNALVVAIVDKRAPLSDEEISAIYKKFGYEEAMGRSIPSSVVPGVSGGVSVTPEASTPAASGISLPPPPQGSSAPVGGAVFEKLHNPLQQNAPTSAPSGVKGPPINTPEGPMRNSPTLQSPSPAASLPTSPAPLSKDSASEFKPLPDLPDLPPPPPAPAIGPSSFMEAPEPPRSGFIKTASTAEVPRIGQEEMMERQLQYVVTQIRSTFGADADRPATEVIRELKASSHDLYQPLAVLLAQGHSPMANESVVDFYYRASKIEMMRIKTPGPTPPVEHVASATPRNSAPVLRAEEHPVERPRFAEKAVKQPEVRSGQPSPEVPPGGTPRPELPVNKVIAEKWASVASNGIFENRYWQSVRGTSVVRLMNGPQGNLGTDDLRAQTLESAQWQMRNSIQKTYAMGFRAMENETGGAYLDRIAESLGKSLSNEQINYRAHNIYDHLTSREITVRGNLNDTFTATRIMSEQVLPGMNTTPAGQEFMQVQKVLLRIYANTGVEPVPGESVRMYAERAIRMQLERTPTLHADMLLEQKKTTLQAPLTPTNNRGAWAREA